MKVVYIVMFLSLWALGLFFLRHRTRSNVWTGLTILLGGTASYTFAMHLSIMPHLLDQPWMIPSLSRTLYLSTVVSIHIYFFLLPYLFFMGGLWLNEQLGSRLKTWTSLLALAGPLLLLAGHLRAEPWNEFDLSRFRWWDGLYFLAGAVLYYTAYFTERHEHRRRSKRRAAALVPTAVLWAFVSDYIGFQSLKLGMWSFDLKSNGMWEANFIIILGTIALILVYIVRYGFLGIKLRIERERLDYSIRALTMGVSILNHSIKNEVQKIDYLAEKCSALLQSGQTAKASQTIEQVHGMTSHLLMMVNRIKEKADDITLQEELHDIREFIDGIVASSATLVAGRNVRVTAAYDAFGQLLCDAVHVRETLYNLLRNSLEVIPESGGSIWLYAAATRRELRIEITDSGPGIPKEHAAKIFEPFFTTKKNTLNHGLGLSYCASVMSKHGGKISVADRKEGEGAKIILHFPRSRFRAARPKLSVLEHSQTDSVNPL